jgi:hypothetical protein
MMISSSLTMIEPVKVAYELERLDWCLAIDILSVAVCVVVAAVAVAFAAS